MSKPWEPQYPVDFSPGGDKTSEALYKHIQEILKVYSHLNLLRTNAEGGAVVKIDGSANTFGELPTAADFGAVWVARDEGKLYIWTGMEWADLGTPAMPVSVREQYDMLIVEKIANTVTATAIADSGDLAYWLKESGKVVALHVQAAVGSGPANAAVRLAINGNPVGNGVPLQSETLMSEEFSNVAINEGDRIELIRSGSAGGDFGNIRCSMIVEV